MACVGNPTFHGRASTAGLAISIKICSIRMCAATCLSKAPAGMVYPGDSQYECGSKLNVTGGTSFFRALDWRGIQKAMGACRCGQDTGCFIDRQMVIALTGFGQDAPFGNAITLTNVNLSDPWATYPGGDPFPTILNKNIPFSTFGPSPTIPYNCETDGGESVEPQRSTAGRNRLAADSELCRQLTIHLVTGNELNPAVFLGLGACTLNGVNYPVCSTTGNTNQRAACYLQNPKEGQYYGSIGSKDDGGTGNYHGLFLSAQKRLSRRQYSGKLHLVALHQRLLEDQCRG